MTFVTNANFQHAYLQRSHVERKTSKKLPSLIPVPSHAGTDCRRTRRVRVAQVGVLYPWPASDLPMERGMGFWGLSIMLPNPGANTVELAASGGTHGAESSLAAPESLKQRAPASARVESWSCPLPGSRGTPAGWPGSPTARAGRTEANMQSNLHMLLAGAARSGCPVNHRADKPTPSGCSPLPPPRPSPRPRCPGENQYFTRVIRDNGPLSDGFVGLNRTATPRRPRPTYRRRPSCMIRRTGSRCSSTSPRCCAQCTHSLPHRHRARARTAARRTTAAQASQACRSGRRCCRRCVSGSGPTDTSLARSRICCSTRTCPWSTR